MTQEHTCSKLIITKLTKEIDLFSFLKRGWGWEMTTR